MFEDDLGVKRKTSSIDLTSMVDVIFILLIFFMVATTFTKLGISINQPESSQVQAQESNTVNIGIDKDGIIYFEKESLTEKQLTSLVKTKLEQDPKLIFVLMPDKDTKTQFLIKTLDTCKLAGANNFSISAKKTLDGN